MSKQLLKDADTGVECCLANEEVRSPSLLLFACHTAINHLCCITSSGRDARSLGPSLPSLWPEQLPSPAEKDRCSSPQLLALPGAGLQRWVCFRGLSLSSSLVFCSTGCSHLHCSACKLLGLLQVLSAAVFWSSLGRTQPGCRACSCSLQSWLQLHVVALGSDVGIICQDLCNF